MQGKTCLVTGATLGIGRETALGLARSGAILSIAGRDPERTRQTAEWLRAESGSASVDAFVADLSTQAGVRKLAEEFAVEHRTLDVLVNNAGGVFSERKVTSEGFEHTWALNHLGYYALTLRLLPNLEASPAARVVNVASGIHFRGHLDFDDLQSERSYDGMTVYAQSKLANVAFTYALARRLGAGKITANVLHPGVVATGFGHNNRGPLNWGLTLLRPFLISAERGAKTSLYLASSPEVEGVSSRYFVRSRPVDSSRESRDQAVQERLWRVSAQQTGLDF